jgi:hypothetical protein
MSVRTVAFAGDPVCVRHLEGWRTSEWCLRLAWIHRRLDVAEFAASAVNRHGKRAIKFAQLFTGTLYHTGFPRFPPRLVAGNIRSVANVLWRLCE